MVEFQRESLKDSWDECLALATENAVECGIVGADHLAPDRDRYLACDEHGLLAFFTARRSGQLIGYGIFFVSPHTHFSGVTTAVQDAFYFLPSERGIHSGKFLIWTDAELLASGAKVLIRQVTNKKDFGRSLSRMGYRPTETVFVRTV